MNTQELIYLLESEQFETREEWESFYRETHRIFDNLSKEEQEMIIEDNSFEISLCAWRLMLYLCHSLGGSMDCVIYNQIYIWTVNI